MSKFLWSVLVASYPCFGITLPEAQKLAIKNNPQLAVIQSEGAANWAKAQSASLTNRPEIGVALGAESDGTLKDRENHPLAFGYFNMTLYDGFHSRIQREAAEHQAERSGLAASWTEVETRRAVEELFLRIAFHEEKNRVLKLEMAAFEGLKKKALARQKAGMIGEADVAEFEVRQADLNEDLMASDLERENFLDQLAFITHQERITGIDGYSLPFIASQKLMPSFTNEIKTLSMQLLESDLQSLSFDKQENKAKWGPRVEFEARIGRLPSEGDWNNKRERVDVLAIAKWNFFNQAQHNSSLQEILEKEKTIAARLVSERNQFDFQHMEQRTKLAALRRKADILMKSKSVAERYHRITMNEYERGVKTSADAAHAIEGFFSNALKDLELRLEWNQRKLLLEAFAKGESKGR